MIALTGATGFLGFHVARRLSQERRAFRVLGRRSRPELEALGVDVRLCDLTSAESVTPHLEGVDTVLHVAGTFEMRGRYRRTMEDANIRTTEALLQAGARLVLCSSSITIGFGPKGAPGNEDTPLDPAVYGRGPLRAYYDTKLAAERLVISGSGVVVNPDFVLGSYDFGPTSGGLLVQLAQGRLPFYPRGGKCFQHVDDCTTGMLAALDRGTAGRRYFLGGENIPYRELLARASRILGRPAPTAPLPHGLVAAVAALASPFGLSPTPDVIRAMALERYRDGSRAKAELGVPSTPIVQAIDEAFTWFRARGTI